MFWGGVPSSVYSHPITIKRPFTTDRIFPVFSGGSRQQVAQLFEEAMTDSRYRLAKQDEMHLDGNANNSEVRIIRQGNRSKRKLSCNPSVLVFVIVLLALTCIALVAFLAIEKMRNNKTSPSLVQVCLTTTNTSGNATQLRCTSAQCVLAASSK